MPFVGITVVPDKCALELDAMPVKYPDDAVLFPRAVAASDDVSGELVFPLRSGA